MADAGRGGGVRDLELPDEDTFTMPAAWRRVIHPRRSGVTGPALTVEGDTLSDAAQLVERLRAQAGRVLDEQGSDPELAKAGRAYLAGADATPLGVAAATAALVTGLSWGEHDRTAVLGDAWVAAHGVVFAAQTAGELAAIWVGNGHNVFAPGADGTAIGRYGSGPNHWAKFWMPAVYRVRAHLASAPDDEYAAAVRVLAEHRDSPHQRKVVAYLACDQVGWVDEAVREVVSGVGSASGMLLCALGTVDQLNQVADLVPFWSAMRMPGMAATVVDGVGPAAAPAIMRWFDRPAADADIRKRLVGVVAQLPTDEAFQTLLDRLGQKYVQPAVVESAARYPVRALRLLAAAATGRSTAAGIAGELLAAHVRGNPELAAAVATALPAPLRERVEALTRGVVTVPTAAPTDLPRVLVEPIWASKRVVAKPVVVPGLTPTAEPAMAWADGEREAWAAMRGRSWLRYPSWEAWAAEFGAGNGQAHYDVAEALAQAPEHLVRPLLATWRPDDSYVVEQWIRSIVARFGISALGLATHVAAQNPASLAGVLLPFAHADVASLMADWLVRLKSARPTTLAWLARHPGVAAAALVPAALAKPGAQRRAAESALRVVAAAGHGGAIRAAAKDHGPAAVEGIEAMLSIDPLDIVPARLPALPEWAAPSMHPPVLLRGRTAALPSDAVRHLGTMLAISKPGDPYAGVAVVRQVTDPASLADFGWSLFRAWQSAGLPAKEGWVLDAQGLIGDDETVRRLAPIIAAWPGEGGHTRAVNALSVLATIGTDVALMHLHRIAQKAKFRGLKDRAGEKIAEVAAALGLTAEQLGDRLVPDLGLDASGRTVLDYGPRRFTVGFDEQLKPFVSDSDGKRLKDLPKPGTKDDAALAGEAYQRFVALKKDVRTIAGDQLRRLEQAMVTRRRWTAPEFRQLFVEHPVVWHLSRRLVWGVYGEEGLIGSLRVAEDRTFADVEDSTVELAEDAVVGIAHRLDLTEVASAWSGVFADYEILQPFPQLGRQTYELSDTERAAATLARFENRTVPTTKVLGLERRGWLRGEPQDGGVSGWFSRVVPGGRAVVVDLEPGIPAGAATEFPEQRLHAVWLNDEPRGVWFGRQGRVAFGALDAVTTSEVLRDLTELVS